MQESIQTAATDNPQMQEPHLFSDVTNNVGVLAQVLPGFIASMQPGHTTVSKQLIPRDKQYYYDGKQGHAAQQVNSQASTEVYSVVGQTISSSISSERKK